MKKLIIIFALLLIAPSVQSAEIIPIWNKALEDNIQDMELLPGGDEFLILSGIAEGSKFQIRNIIDGELIRQVSGYYASFANFEFTPDSSRIVVTNGADGDLELRNLQTFEKINSKFVTRPEGFTAFIKNIAIDPIRPYVYVTQNGDNGNSSNYEVKSKISVYNYETMELVKDLTDYNSYEYSAIAVSDDGKYLATLNDGKAYLKVWDLETMELIREVQLWDDTLKDFWCDSKDIQFSKLNSDVVYYSGLFPSNQKGVQAGIHKFIISSEISSEDITNSGYSGKIILFDKENKSLIYSSRFLYFNNFKNKTSDRYYKPSGIYPGDGTIYNEIDNYFIGFEGSNICKFLYDGETNIETNIDEQIIISPNPTNSIVNVKLSCSDAQINYQIYDINGEVLMQNTSEIQANGLQVDFSTYPVGVYFINVECNNHSKTYKIVKEG